MTARLSYNAMRIEAEASRCPECGGIPSVVDAGDGLTLRCPRHPGAVIGRWENNVTSEANVEMGLAIREPQVVAARELTALTQEQNTAALQLANMLRKQGPQWLEKASAAEVLTFGRIATMLGLNPLIGECYLLHGTFYVSRDGRRLRALATGECEGISEPRMLMPDEERIYGVHEGDIARVVEVFRKGWRIPSVGCGIVRKSEVDAARSGNRAKGYDGRYHKPIAENPEHMAAKRAEVAALKKAFPEVVPARSLQVAEDREHDLEVRVLDQPADLSGDDGERELGAIPTTARGSDFGSTDEGEESEPREEPMQEAAERLPFEREEG